VADAVSSPAVRRVFGPKILLHSGNYFDFLDPEGSTFTIQDIARGLSHICRFCGQVNRYYSVCQHSVLMSRMVPHEHALAALLQDAPEAFIGDMSRPLKDICPDYRRIEARVEVAVLSRLGIELPFDPCIHEADVRMLATEQQQLMTNRDDWDYTRGHKPYDIYLGSWPPDEAMAKFLSRYRALTAK
jgi:hypothetical protein